MKDKTQVCDIIFDMIVDEKKAPKDYRKLKSLLKRGDKKIISGIIKDEVKHKKRLKRLSSRLRCRTPK